MKEDGQGRTTTYPLPSFTCTIAATPTWKFLAMPIQTPFKTVSEELLAEYLDGHQYDWDYEPPIAGKSKVPDFRVRRGALGLLCDVKERSPKTAPPGARAFDPIKCGRKLIESGRDKFVEFDDRLCALVVFNNGDCDTRLDPTCIFGAMLGRPGFSWGVDTRTGRGVPGSAHGVFLERDGKMVSHYRPFTPRASTSNISSVIALSQYRVPNPLFEEAFDEKSAEFLNRLGRELTFGEECELRYSLIENSIPMTLKDVARVVVCVNPFARHPLPDQLFNGPYDERWSIVDGQLRRVFAGGQLKAASLSGGSASG
ncbi:MAG: hypothetical protein RIC55_09375 [Pirellulaceae bacterium]